ncbi:MAG: putative DNA binding domain-containing protein [Anaerolineae bacterium]|nr:putative DNA binding domain-containing protein [Anaerolineae bacterium]
MISKGMVHPSRPEATQLVALLPGADVQALAETIVAFANADGGTLYVGITLEGRPTGAVFPEEFEGLVRQAEMLCRPPIFVKWEQLEVRGAFIFVGQVQRSPELHTLTDGRVIVRTGPENRVLTGEQVQQLASTRQAGEYEAEPVPVATREDLDSAILERFLEAWESRQGPRPRTRTLDDILLDLGWLLPTGQPTVAGLLLFGKNPQTFIPRSGLVFVRFDGKQVRQAEGKPAYGRRVEVKGPLPQVIEHTWTILQEEIRKGAVVSGLQRQEKWEYPPAAIREALVNAVAHRDYKLKGRAIEVRMFTDRLEIASPGGLPGFITVDNIVEEHYSRNPRIVNGLFQWGYIEELGLGVDLMIEEMTNAGHPLPDFKESPFAFTVTFRNIQEREPITVPDGQTMSERQAQALAFIQKHGRITSRDYQQLCPDVSPETLRLDMVDLVERGILLKVGQKRGTYYILK